MKDVVVVFEFVLFIVIVMEIYGGEYVVGNIIRVRINIYSI